MRAAALIAVVAAAVAAAPAVALTCAPPDPQRLYAEARDADETFIALHGSFAADGPPEVFAAAPGTRSVWRGTLSGLALNRDGFVLPYSAPATFRFDCIGNFGCPGTLPDQPFLGFVEMTPDGPLMLTDSCSSRLIAEPSPAALEAVILCHRGGPCG